MREAIITLSDDELAALGFGKLVGICREAGIRDAEILDDDGVDSDVEVEVESRLDGEELGDLPCVKQWELAAEKSETFIYLLTLSATEVPDSATDDHDDLVGGCDITMSDRGAFLSMIGSQEAIRDMLRNFEQAGVIPELHKLGEYEGDDDALDALTNRQLETIKTAYELGFYEVPRQATTEDVASELGVDSATVSEHLQRAERNLLNQQLPV